MNTHDPGFTLAVNQSRLDERLAHAQRDRVIAQGRPRRLTFALRQRRGDCLVRLGGRISPLTGVPGSEPGAVQPGT